MLESVVANGHSFEECKEVLKQSTHNLSSLRYLLTTSVIALCDADISLDPGFKDFYRYCKEHDIPVVIISRSVSPRRKTLLRSISEC